MRLTRPLVLASASPRRQQLLEEAGLAFEALATPAEAEERLAPGLPPGELAERSALAKARWAAQRRPQAVVLGADTIVVLGEEILGKPTDREDARGMLARLSGRTHRVITGFALIGPGLSCVSRVETAVRFRPLDEGAIDRYLESGEPMDKAGAYAIQGMGGSLVDRVEGSYTNVIGLPLPEVLVPLRDCGILEDGPIAAPPERRN
ncbi:MAG: Maf family protein [bacterium]